ncbi:phage distal tail protein [Streptomyces sp. Wb2n-11]|uniref:phage distal tail protein n=1 Tax=Streptomyces sp. Wb2n-11 TaxID=1030533 RepID=UPI000ABC83A4|nr:phage tail domain-containing protein [Streptomyces sp. Wb2n-11]
MAELEEGQWELGGVLMGAGTQIPVAEVTGLGRPSTRGEDIEQPGMDGVFLGVDYYAARSIEIDAAIKVPGDPDACWALLSSLQTAADATAVRLTGGATMPLRYRRRGAATKRVDGRLRRLEPQLSQVIYGWMPLDIEFVAADARWYGDEQQTTEIPLGWMSGGGFTAPVAAPIHVTSATSVAERPGWVETHGDVATWPVLRITGPCSAPAITHVSTGRTLALPTLVLGVGQWVELDTRPGRRRVVWNNGGNAESYLTPSSRLDLFSLPPGTSELRWTAVDPTNTSRLRVTWRDAYRAA